MERQGRSPRCAVVEVNRGGQVGGGVKEYRPSAHHTQNTQGARRTWGESSERGNAPGEGDLNPKGRLNTFRPKPKSNHFLVKFQGG